MMILITYDVDTSSQKGVGRLRQVAKVCVDHGQRVQNSVFECLLTEAQFVILKKHLEDIIDTKVDSIRFYFLGKRWQKRVEHIGKETSYNMEDSLII